MKAQLFNLKSDFNTNHRKERYFYKELTAFTVLDGEIKTVATIRYYATDARHYAACWVHHYNGWGQGTGYAGGWGYCRESAAAAEALQAAGVKLSQDINGRGQSAVIEALEAIAAEMYPGGQVYIHSAHA